jgi:hypothetical protein
LENGQRLAKRITHRRILLILDGLEPLQYPPGSQEGRLRDLSLRALLRELAAFNSGLCVITRRLPVADLADSRILLSKFGNGLNVIQGIAFPNRVRMTMQQVPANQ